ncbi:MAG: Txe/YoeB family addiction module toxin [Gordonibacter sp.]|uniref:Txe/YoeB family addiction module toxin n=1 Tax=Gordonibacter sp. TaxID=1968902 RepID=UPI002FCB24E2
MKKLWSDKAWDDYLYWQTQDKRTLRRINKLLASIERSKESPDDQDKPIGKAEKLKYSNAGLFSVRIDETNRLVYKIEENGTLSVVSCKGHYQ